MKRFLLILLLLPSIAFATDFDDTDQMYGWDTSTGQFYQTWADHKSQLSLLYQAIDSDLTTYAGITPSANVQSLLSAADYAAIRALLDLEAGTDFNAYDADLTTYAGITPSANVQSLLSAADYAAIRTLLALGTAALLDSGSAIGNVVLWEDDGSGNASISIGSTDLPLMGDYSVNGTSFDGDANGKIDAALLDAGATAIADLSDWPAGLTATELGYVDSVTSAIQTQLNAKASLTGEETLTTKTIDADDNVLQDLPISQTFTIVAPQDADDPLIYKFPRAATLVSLSCVALGGGTISVDIQECDADGANCTTTGATIASCGATNTDDSTLTDAAVDATDWYKLVIGAPSGTVDQVSVSLQWKESW
jgi:hypothetical protein